MRIDIVSDVICPWCFIGKRRLATALAQRPEVDAEILWHPFQLNPDMPAEGMARERYIAAKFGGPDHAKRIYQTVTDVGAAVGIPFHFERIKVTPNTRNAHRLIRYAAADSGAETVVEALFNAYFIEGRDIGDRETLADIAEGAGIGRAAVSRYLASDEASEDVLAEDMSARRIGINAVPCFIFERKYVVSGAQEPEFFYPLFDLLRNEQENGVNTAAEPLAAK
ncbi:MAG TPA: DsbA family oxidoreductase [Stellaceae bacterium]|nr:DsbA family oxidoreductase [Stellaceae bacterium]